MVFRQQSVHFLRPDKIILVVRDPVDRIVSSWAQILENRVKKGLPPPNHTLEDKILNKAGRVNRREKSVRTSTYLKSYRQWYKVREYSVFDDFRFTFQLFKGRILVIDANELVDTPWKRYFNTFGKVTKFLFIEISLLIDFKTFIWVVFNIQKFTKP